MSESACQAEQTEQTEQTEELDIVEVIIRMENLRLTKEFALTSEEQKILWEYINIMLVHYSDALSNIIELQEKVQELEKAELDRITEALAKSV